MAGFQLEENSLEVLHPYWIPAVCLQVSSFLNCFWMPCMLYCSHFQASSFLMDASHFAWCIKWLLSFSSGCHMMQPFGLQVTWYEVTSLFGYQSTFLCNHPGLLKLGLHSWLHIITRKCIHNYCHSVYLTCKPSSCCMSVILIQGLWSTRHAWLFWSSYGVVWGSVRREVSG